MSIYERIVTLPDVDASTTPQYDCAAASSLSLNAMSTAGASSITVRLFAFDKHKCLCGIMPPLMFTSSTHADYGTSFSGTPNGLPQWDITSVDSIAIKVDAVSGGSWNLRLTVAD